MNTKTNTTQTPVNTCACGTCGQQVGPKATYRPGHDARHVSVLVATLQNSIADGREVTKATITTTAKQLPSEALRGKFIRAAERMLAKEAA